MKHLFLFTLGPVQSFIAQARKTHDLYAGSMLLSDLIKSAIGVVGEQNLIFPKMGEAMPNRFLAEVPANVTDFQAFGDQVERVVREKWQQIANNALNDVDFKPPGFDEQIVQFLEVFWVIEPLESDVKYSDTLRRLERNLAAIKNVRPFTQFTWQNGLTGERGRKCSLDGQRNVLFYRPKNDVGNSEEGSPLYTTPGSVFITDRFAESVLKPGEGLSAVSFAKRRYTPEDQSEFASTAEIALWDVLSILERTGNGETKTCVGLLRQINAQLFYEENSSIDTLYKYLEEAKVKSSSADSIKRCNEKVRKEAEKAGLKMAKYYTILTFDGDDMGKWLSGDNLADQSNLRVFQDKFSSCLLDFAQEAKFRLDNRSGQTIYAGGDDFLGFVNLNHLLQVLQDLRVLFYEKVDVPLQHFKERGSDKVSFSAGICVAHYKEPLTLVLQEARSAQKKAKELDRIKKDSFAITVIKGSGENHTTVLPFGENADNVMKLHLLTRALINDEFSNNFIKTMRLEFERVMDFKGERAEFEEVFKAELRRLLLRASNDIDRDKKKQGANVTASMLMDLFGTNSTENFFQMLHIADFFRREMDVPMGQLQFTQAI